MKILCSKYIYPKDKENLDKIFQRYKGIDLQLSFFHHKDFFDFDHKKILRLVKKYKINIKSVHVPTTDVFYDDFFLILEAIKKLYNVKILTIHPQRFDRKDVLQLLDKYSEKIKNLKIILAYEIFPHKRKWISFAKDMYKAFDKEFLKITYDTSHTRAEDIMEELKSVIDKVAIIHLSSYINGKEHQPINQNCVEIVKYLKSINFKGFIVLEYMQEFEDKLIKDYFYVKNVRNFPPI